MSSSLYLENTIRLDTVKVTRFTATVVFYTLIGLPAFIWSLFLPLLPWPPYLLMSLLISSYHVSLCYQDTVCTYGSFLYHGCHDHQCSMFSMIIEGTRNISATDISYLIAQYSIETMQHSCFCLSVRENSIFCSYLRHSYAPVDDLHAAIYLQTFRGHNSAYTEVSPSSPVVKFSTEFSR